MVDAKRSAVRSPTKADGLPSVCPQSRRKSLFQSIMQKLPDDKCSALIVENPIARFPDAGAELETAEEGSHQQAK